jgi:c-di-GMP-binding flagellar brake protein YcgR
MNNREDSRVFRRVKLTLPAMCETTDQDDKKISFGCWTRDVGVGGACVVLKKDCDFRIGQKIDLSVEFDQDQQPVRTGSKICWLSRDASPDSRQIMGVELEGSTSPLNYERWLEMLGQYFLKV